MTAKLVKIGNSLYILINRQALEHVGAAEGDQLELTISKKEDAIVNKIDAKIGPRVSEGEMLDTISRNINAAHYIQANSVMSVENGKRIWIMPGDAYQTLKKNFID